MKKAIVLVIDGLGVGAMPDVRDSRPDDIGANTLTHILKAKPKIKLPHLEKSGAIDYFTHQFFSPHRYQNLCVCLGKSALAHFGADSFMAHQEIVGTLPPPPVRQFVRHIKTRIISHLKKHHYPAVFNGKYILVNKSIAIADNIETDYGLNINVVGSLDQYHFDQIAAIGYLVREVIQVGRVITMGGTPLLPKDFTSNFQIKTKDHYCAWGINIPGLNIYNSQYQVIHMGYGIDPNTQVTSLITQNQKRLILIGKTADVITAPAAISHPAVNTQTILDKLLSSIKQLETSFIFANIQETDLAGHRQDTDTYSHLLELIDSYLPDITAALSPNDLFIIMGDHGNDPTIGHSLHTREFTPLIVFSKNIHSVEIGTRNTLSDVGATIADFFHLPSLPHGQSFLPLLT